jgi:hypothetical protein
MEMLWQPVVQWLRSATVGELFPQTKVFAVESTTALGKVMKLLAERAILSAPVVSPADAQGRRRVVGIIDVADITALAFRFPETEGRAVQRSGSENAGDYSGFGVEGPFFTQTTEQALEKVRKMSGRDAADIPLMASDARFLDLVKIFAAGRHRAIVCRYHSALPEQCRTPSAVYFPVTELEGLTTEAQPTVAAGCSASLPAGCAEVVGYVSQTDAVSFLAEHVKQLGALRDQPVTSYCSKWPIIVPADRPAWVGFGLLCMKQVMAVAVLDESRGFIGALSSVLLRALDKDNLQDMHLLTCGEFLDKYSGRASPTVCVTRLVSFSETLSILAEKRLHRVWVTQNGRANEIPFAVFSLTDAFRTVMRNVGEQGDKVEDGCPQ